MKWTEMSMKLMWHAIQIQKTIFKNNHNKVISIISILLMQTLYMDKIVTLPQFIDYSGRHVADIGSYIIGRSTGNDGQRGLLSDQYVRG